eukprot:CAMPEP_0183474878 /NCGR_PEP_ID=MMETSP0370-20130417/163825_1 /TAXON_ID=268820 /ORGANISM="Peridinium aciculiferum, Strain PAER-2" /LENGTH=40 /DNA_ID= /DNA_START= /DNA_END= /DNA_ORIENTATION=
MAHMTTNSPTEPQTPTANVHIGTQTMSDERPPSFGMSSAH